MDFLISVFRIPRASGYSHGYSDIIALDSQTHTRYGFSAYPEGRKCLDTDCLGFPVAVSRIVKMVLCRYIDLGCFDPWGIVGHLTGVDIEDGVAILGA